MGLIIILTSLIIVSFAIAILIKVEINRGDKFAQGIFVQYGTVIDDDAVEERNGGFGSTNK